MPSAYFDVQDWSEGVNSSTNQDEIPPNASPLGLNASLLTTAGGRAIPTKRLGMTTLNATPVTGTPTIHGAYEFERTTGGTTTRTHLLVSDGGRLDSVDSNGALTTISASAFTSGDYLPDFTTAQNLCFIANGQDAIQKYDGTSLTNAGITRPTVGTFAGAAGAAGTPNATYELRVTYRNSSTGHESSISDTATSTVTLTSEKLDVSNVPVSGDGQVDQRRIYVRNTATMAYFFLVHTIEDNVSTTASDINWTDSSLITKAPDTTENDPPAAHKYVVWHRNRLFAAGAHANPSQITFSKLGLPEAFDPDNFERINELDGDIITGLYSYSDMLIIFKENSVWGLIGDNPATWEVRPLFRDLGCVSHRSICSGSGWLFWWGRKGPTAWDGASLPVLIGLEYIHRDVATTQINQLYVNRIACGVDIMTSEVFWAIPAGASTVLSKILVWNLRLNRWSGLWDPMEVGCFATVQDTEGFPRVFLHGLKGQAFRMNQGTIDGVAPGTTHTGTFTAVTDGDPPMTITDLTASFDTTGGGLVERKVTVLDSNGRQVGSIRPKITSNTSTVLTISPSVSGMTNGGTYTYVVGAPNFVWDTAVFDQDLPFHKKRYEFVYLSGEASSAANIWLDMEVDYNSATRKTRTVSLTQPAGSLGSGLWSGFWGSGEWGSMIWGSPQGSNLPRRFRVGMRGHAIQCRIRSPYPNQPFVLRKFGVRSMIATDRREDT